MKLIELELEESEARLVENVLRPQLSRLVSVVHSRDKKPSDEVRESARRDLRDLGNFLTKWNYVLVRFRQ